MIRAHNTQSNVLAKYWRDASGHRAVKDVDGAKTVFFNLGTTQMEAYDVLSDMGTSTIHQPGIDSPLAEVSSSGTLTFYHQDWLGNVVMLTNAGGAKVQTYTYDVWGKPSGFDSAGAAITPSSFASRLLFTGREYDPETALYHYRARAYSPTLGRFMQTDPIDFSAGDVNMFRYVSNNPINFVDPLGLLDQDVFSSSDRTGNSFKNTNTPDYDFGGHRNSKTVQNDRDSERGKGNKMSPKEVADMIRNDPNYDDDCVRLFSCSTGKGENSFAQRLADELNVPVTAPGNNLIVDSRGNTRVDGHKGVNNN